MFLIFSTLIYLLAALALTRLLFHTFRFSRWVVCFYLTAFTVNVFTAEVLSILHALNQPWLFFLIQLLICGGVVLFALHKKVFNLEEIKKDLQETWSEFRLIDGILLTVIVLITGSLLVVGATTPPNNLDSLHTHLPRIYYWLQHGSFEPWSAAALAQLTYPINAHLQGLWLFLFSHHENTFFLVQWTSMVVILCAVAEIARLLGFSQRQSLTAAMVTLSFPVMLLQSYSFQGDLTVTALILLCVLFLFSFRKEDNPRHLMTAMLPLALALGTKQTAFFFLPAAGLLLLFWLCKRYLSPKHLLHVMSVFLVCFLLLSAFQYLQNLSQTGSLFGQEIVSDAVPENEARFSEKLVYNTGRFLYQFISFDGVPPRYALPLQAGKAYAFERLTERLRIDLEQDRFLPPEHDWSEKFDYDAVPVLSEDTAWYGPLSFLLLPMALIAAAFRKEARQRQYLLLALIFVFSYDLILLWQRPGWDPYQGRYFFLGLAPVLPLIAGLIPRKKAPAALVTLMLAAITLTLGIYTVFFNQSKPIITRGLGYTLMNEKVLSLPKTTRWERGFRFVSYTVAEAISEMEYSVERYSIYQSRYEEQVLFSDASLVEDLEWINAIIPPDAAISLAIQKSPLEFALFGKNKTRDLFPFKGSETPAASNYYLIEKIDGNPLDFPALELLGENERFLIYRKSSISAVREFLAETTE